MQAHQATRRVSLALIALLLVPLLELISLDVLLRPEQAALPPLEHYQYLVATTTFWSFGTAVWSETPGTALLYLSVACYAIAQGHRAAAPVLAGIGGALVGATFFIRLAILTVLPAVALMAFALASRRERGWSRLPAIFLAWC